MKKILLVDLWNVFMIQWHAGVNRDARFPFDTTMARVRTLAQAYDHTAIMTDGGASFRREVDPRWKKNRDEKYAGAVMMLAEVERALSENFHVFKVPHLEADDLIASAVHQMRSWDEWAEGDLSMTINSGDKDLLSLLEPGVEILSTNSGKIVRAEDLRQNAKYGVDPCKMRDFLLLADAHNGVNYVRGIGAKNAAVLLNTFGDLDGIVAALDKPDPADPKKMLVHPPSIREALLTATRETIGDRPLLDVALDIVTLRTDAPFDFMTIFNPISAPAQATDWSDEENDGQVPNQNDAGGERGRADHADVRRASDDRHRQDCDPAERQPQTGSGDASSSGDAGPAGGRGSAAIEVVSRPTALAAPPGRWELSLEPQSPREAMLLAKSAWAAGFWPKHGSADGCLLIILAGRAKGIPAFDALNGMHIMDGKPTFGAHLIIGMVRASKVCERIDLVESDEKHALWITKRRKSKVEQRSLYTIQMATDAELVKLTSNGKRSNWQKNPQDMLVKTAGAKLCRWVYQDVTGGFVATEEIEDS